VTISMSLKYNNLILENLSSIYILNFLSHRYGRANLIFQSILMLSD
jgi:hypothetical protein